jgi:hypothetical protein
MTDIKKPYNRKLMLLALVIKAITGVVGASLVLTETHPYLALSALSLAAAANEFILFVEKEKNRV